MNTEQQIKNHPIYSHGAALLFGFLAGLAVAYYVPHTIGQPSFYELNAKLEEKSSRVKELEKKLNEINPLSAKCENTGQDRRSPTGILPVAGDAAPNGRRETRIVRRNEVARFPNEASASVASHAANGNAQLVVNGERNREYSPAGTRFPIPTSNGIQCFIEYAGPYREVGHPRDELFQIDYFCDP